MRPTRKLAHKALVAWLVYSLGFNPLLVAPAFAASADMSDVPLPARKRPNPNLIFAVDDSGSMDGEVSIDANDGAAWYYTAGLSDNSVIIDGKTDPSFWGLNKKDKQQTGVPNFNMDGTADYSFKKYVYLNPNGQCGSNCDTRSYADASNDHFAISPSDQFSAYRSPDFNKQYYNPTITYLPWKSYNDGTGACPSGTATGGGSTYICTPGNADPKNARSHPIYGSEKADLTVDIAKNTNTHRYFRLYHGMRVLPGAEYRRCKDPNDGGNCSSWSTASTVMCVREDSTDSGSKATCERGLGTISNFIDMKTNQYDHVDMAVAYYPATYFVSESSTIVDPAKYTGFPLAFGLGPSSEKMRQIEIKSGTPTYPKGPGRTDCAGATTCTYAEELQNYANWWQYYRKRHMSLSAAIGNALDGVRSLRGGWFQFNNRVAATMYDFDLSDTTKNARRLIGLMYRSKGTGGTPTRDTMSFLGDQFKRTDAGAPITAACQFNGGFIITDGFASTGGATPAGNYDGQTPAGTKYPTTADPTQDNFVYNQQFGVSPVQTAPYADTWSNTLADMAMKFYTENPRPTLPLGKVPVNKNDTSPNADRNVNLHVNMYGLVLGLAGEIFASPDPKYALQNADPFANPPDWATLYGGVDPRTIARDPRAIDELWHAALNGRGDMLKADSPEQTRNAVLDVVNKVVAKGGAAAAVSVSNANPIPGDNFTYQSSYNAGVWGGDLNVFEIDLATGEVKDTALWNPSAQKRLADKDWTTRLIASYDPANAVGVPLQWGSLTPTQQTSLGGLVVGSTAIQGQWVLDWLRGDRSRETTLLRSRGPRKDPATGKWTGGVIPEDVTVLGDVVNAEPIVVGPPKLSYLDAGYTAYKNGLAKSRQKVAYQAANEGMLHAFDAGILIDPPTGLYSAGTGEELWAYVPSFGFQARQTGKAGLRTLADKEFFIHQFFVDGTPVSADVDLDKAGSATGSGSPNWATLVVGGLGKGGRGWYALDVTSPTVVSEGALASKVLWEFPNTATASPNVGYSFGRPIVVKTRARGWVVAVTSGYENGNETGGDGRGHLFILNPATGAVIADLTTIDAEDGAGTAANRQANPRGLTYVSAYVENGESDATVEAIYGGDLYGNVWKFDLSGATQADWNVKRLTTLTDASSNRQPITSEPELALVGNYRVVYVGTGRYLGDKDIPGEPGAFVSATGTQTIYALKDDLTTTPTITGGRSDLFQRTVTKDLVAGTATVTPDPLATIANIFGSTKKGWFADLPETGERVITNPQLGLSVLTVTSNIPDGTDPCIPGGRSWAYFLDYRTGGVIPGATLAGGFLGQALASRAVLIKLPNGTMRALIRLTDATTESLGLPTPASTLSGKRKSWREIIVQ